MKKFAKKITLRSMASACFAGTACCSTILFGQQLQPVEQNDQALPPIVNSAQAAESALPPIVSSQPVPINDQLPPIVSPNSANELPPIVSASSSQDQGLAPVVSSQQIPELTLPPVVHQAANQPQVVAAPLPVNSGTSNAQRGTNFPVDAEARIQEFIEANSNGQMENTQAAYLPQQNIQGHVAPLTPVPVPDFIQPGQTPVAGAPVMIQPQVQVHVDSSPNHFQHQHPEVVAEPGQESYFESEYTSDGYGPEAMDYGSVCDTFDCCGFVCDSRNYLIFDALYWKREDGVFRASNITNIDDLDHAWGGRITWGTKRDSTRGFEASYMHLDSLLAVSPQTNAAGTLFGALFGNATTGNLPANAFTAFRNGTYAQQYHKSDLNSLELNRTWWGSDVVKAFIGARYVHFDDEFRLSMANTAGQQGYHSISTTNDMFGLHIGGEVLYDIGYRLSFSIGAKLGGYLNFSDSNLTHQNNGAIRAFGSNKDSDFAWTGELGAWARYKLSPNVRLRAGYEGFGLYDIKEVESAFSTIVSSNSGRGSYPDGNALFHGPSFGIEIYR